MKLLGNIFLFVGVFWLLCPFSFGKNDEQTVKKPYRNSKIGYLTVVKNNVVLIPGRKKCFIPPRNKLEILENTSEYVVLLVDRLQGSVFCKITKTPWTERSMAFMQRENKVFFQGGVEGEVLPIKLTRNQELPIVSEDSAGWIADLKLNKLVFPIYIPKNKQGVKFARKSRFAKFAEEQLKKNLAYYKGKWLPVDDVRKLEKKARITKEKQLEKWKNVIAVAKKGFLVLKNGTVIEGKLKGHSSWKHLLFSGDGEVKLYDIDNIADDPADVLIAKANVHRAGVCFRKMNSCAIKKNWGEAVKWGEKTAELCHKVERREKEQFRKANALLFDVMATMDIIYDTLDKENKSVYQYNIFPRKVLKYHQDRKHILVNGQNWIAKKQLCKNCQGKGSVDCPKCKASGKVKKKCPDCKKGLVKCAVCSGSGWRTCEHCNGSGSVKRRCSSCGGRKKIFSERPPVYSDGGWEGPTIITSGCRPYLCRKIGRPCGNTVVILNNRSWVGSWYWPAFIDCLICGGTGYEDFACSACKGTGVIRCPKFTKCKKCHGKGKIISKCPTCKGQKKITCPNCHGKGFQGEPQKMPEMVRKK